MTENPDGQDRAQEAPLAHYQPHHAPAERYQAQPPQPAVVPRSAGVAVLASFFIPGLGSMMNERAGKGTLILACYLVTWGATVVTFGFLFLLPIAVVIWGMVAGSNDAHRWNRAHGLIS